MKKIIFIFWLALLAGCDKPQQEVKITPAAAADTSETTAVQAQEVAISEAWVRSTAPGQNVGAAYMTLTSPQDSTLVYVESAAANEVQIHSMSMDKGVMKMRMLEELLLKASTPEKLAPGGFHLMLFDLVKPLAAGEGVTFKLCFKDISGNISHQEVMLPIMEEAPK